MRASGVSKSGVSQQLQKYLGARHRGYALYRALVASLLVSILLLSQAQADSSKSDKPSTKSGFEDVPEFGGPSSVGSELKEGDALTDPQFRFPELQQFLQPWFDGKRKLHDEYGLSLGTDFQALYQAVSDSDGEDEAAGRMFRAFGSWTLLGQDSGNTGSLVFKVEHRQRLGTDVAPQSLGFEAGALAITGTQFSDIGWALTNLYWHQRFKERRISVLAGQLDVTDYLDVYGLINPLTAFSNLAFSTNPAIPAPNQGLGAAAGLFITDNVYAIAGFVDANGDPTDPDMELFDDFETFKHVELGWTTSFDRRYFDNIHVTLWQVDERDEAGVDDDWGVAASASWFVDNRWVPFLRAGWSDKEAALVQKNVSGGIGYLARSRDLIGVGLNWGRPASDALDDQYIGEVFYRLQLGQNIAITPSLQVIVDPALQPDEDTLYVVGLRGRISM